MGIGFDEAEVDGRDGLVGTAGWDPGAAAAGDTTAGFATGRTAG